MACHGAALRKHAQNTGKLNVCKTALHVVLTFQLTDTCRMGYSLNGKKGAAQVGDSPLCLPPSKQSIL